MADKAFLVNTLICTGCRSCQTACKQWNSLPGETHSFFAGPEITNPGRLSAVTWTHVSFNPYKPGDGRRPLWDILHKKCFHCKDAACLRGCPERAIFRDDGWVLINQKKCTGCRQCTTLCPYTVPHVSTEDHRDSSGGEIILKDKAYKCNACMVNKRDVPACVDNCLAGAITYGHRLFMIKQANLLLEGIKKENPGAAIYGIKESGGLRVILLLREKPENYGLPVPV